jgi:hypothetical protein
VCTRKTEHKTLGANNGMGRFLDIDEKTLKKEVIFIAKICVELKLGTDGLHDTMDIEIGRWSYCYLINYVQIPFRCSIFKGYGHLKRAFHKKYEEDEGLKEEAIGEPK